MSLQYEQDTNMRQVFDLQSRTDSVAFTEVTLRSGSEISAANKLKNNMFVCNRADCLYSCKADNTALCTAPVVKQSHDVHVQCCTDQVSKWVCGRACMSTETPQLLQHCCTSGRRQCSIFTFTNEVYTNIPLCVATPYC